MEMYLKILFLGTTELMKQFLGKNVPWMVLYKVFFAAPKSKIAADSLVSDPMGTALKIFSETTELMKIFLCRNVPWMVLYKVWFFLPIQNPRWLPPQDIV